MKKRMGKKGQVTLFIIIALMIVIIAIIVYINRGKIEEFTKKETPINGIKNCINEPIKKGVENIALQGGSLEPKNYFLYEGNKVEYICYSEEFYKMCVMQKPLLKENFENELKLYMAPRINNCLKFSKENLLRKGYEVSYNEPEIDVNINRENIEIITKVNLKIKEDEKTESFDEIRTKVDSNIYNLIMIAGSISNWEARFGDSESLLYMMNNQNLKVEKKKQSEGTKIYILSDREYNDKLMVATRSGVIPVGITGK